jgi:YbbR domain-containing protein
MSRKKIVDVIISIACAFALWAYVTTEINPPEDTTIRGVHVDLINMEALAADNMTVASEPFAVDVAIRGTKSELRALTAEDFSATADMSNFLLGANNVEVKVTGPAESVEILAVNPNRIEVHVEELIVANKPIRLSYSEAFPPGMEPGFISVTPKEIAVSGTKADVGGVSYARAEIDSAQLRESERTINADVIPVDKSGDRAYGVEMSQNSVEVTMRLCYVKEVPLVIDIVGQPPGALAVTKRDVPEKVSIRGAEEALAGIDKVTAAPIDLGALRSTTIITPALNLPEDVEPAEASRDLAVTIEIGGEEAKSLTVTGDMIEIRGLPEGYSANIVTGMISATVFGSHEQIAAITTKKLELYVDLTDMDLTPGQVKAPILYGEADSFKRMDILPTLVDVRVTAPPDANVSPETVPQPENISGSSLEENEGNESE